MKIFFASLPLLILFVSCSPEQDYTVGYLNPSKDRVRFLEEGNYMIEKLEEAGIKTIVNYAKDNDALQMEQGFEMLEQGVDVLVIPAINGVTIKPLVEQAKSEGVIVVAYNMMINDVSYDLYVSGDNRQLAKDFCDFVLEKKPSGRYVILGGDRFDHNGYELKNNIDSILCPFVEEGTIEIVYDTFIERWSREHARHEFSNVLNVYGNSIDAVISCNDAMGLGVIDALSQRGIVGDVTVTGQDATLEGVRSIYKGEMGITFLHPRKQLGQKTAELIIEMLIENKKGKELVDMEVFNGTFWVPASNVKSIPVTKENLDILVDKGIYSWLQIRE